MDTALITGFARQLAAEVEWVPGNEQQLYRALRNRKIDLLIGHITEQTPSEDNTARSRPHLENTNYAYVGYKNRWRTSSPGKPAVSRSRPASGARQPQSSSLPTGGESAKASPVIAVPASEKAWLAALENYLNQRQLASTRPARIVQPRRCWQLVHSLPQDGTSPKTTRLKLFSRVVLPRGCRAIRLCTTAVLVG
ncbi:transporter substrate-binding domain-containing protein [Hymenobacter cellulosilyticus]|uniref:Solute-binding protein family 3/N-terminal domain-containing protein n=1 Tax=Hymenobacter cellulosilyticus TaxID=2932248 RepID=A0A8T9Q7J0_9BACT|nr:hypothetical protein [Hymenobacter cellulosilyticus]UOQ73547.1 hypothetical protein MUN79_06345 [Hymenobacter cellulosilyticus]